MAKITILVALHTKHNITEVISHLQNRHYVQHWMFTATLIDSKYQNPKSNCGVSKWEKAKKPTISLTGKLANQLTGKENLLPFSLVITKIRLPHRTAFDKHPP